MQVCGVARSLPGALEVDDRPNRPDGRKQRSTDLIRDQKRVSFSPERNDDDKDLDQEENGETRPCCD